MHRPVALGGSRPARRARLLVPALLLASASALGAQEAPPEVHPLEVHYGEPLDPALYGPGVVESMDAALERERQRIETQGELPPEAEPMPGAWVLPTRRSVSVPHSGELHLLNERGSLSMGIGFPTLVDLEGAWIGGQSDAGAWPPALRAVGYRDGVAVAASEWMTDVAREPRWLAIGMAKIDRVVFEALPAVGNAAWYTLDDLTYSYVVPGVGALPERVKRVVLDFEDCTWKQKLTGSDYAGLVWESGSAVQREDGVHAPERPPGSGDAGFEVPAAPPGGFAGGLGTLPDLVTTFQGIFRGEHGSSTYPPDTCGAIGPDHFVEVINRVFAIYDKQSGVKVVGMNLGSFLPGSNGDPRVHFDPHSNRWIVTVTDFDTRIYIAVSLTTDPTGAWFKSNFVISAGSDAGCWSDYPTMGVDANGVYVAGYMVGCDTMSIFAVNKAPLVAATPSLGTITAFRNLPYEGALQPCLTYGSPPGEYVVSTNGTSGIRVRRVNPPLTGPTLVTVGIIDVGTHSDPPTAPAMGSSVNINTVDDRLMNAVFRDDSIWCGHTVNQSGKAACRWYELGTAPLSMLQKGTITDAVLHYYFPGITVNVDGDVAVGFSGSHAGQFVGAYYTGRKATDAPNEMATPAQFRAGQAAQNNIDGAGRNRWGDYSLSNVDPENDRTFWTIQEYAHSTNTWGTQVAEVEFPGADPCPDPTNYCSTAPNSVGLGMQIASAGSTSVAAEDFVLLTYGGPPNRPGIFYYGAGQTQTPFGNGFRCVTPGGIGTFRLPVLLLDTFGDANYALEWNQIPVCCGAGAIVAGDEWNFQFWYRDPADGGANFNLSDGLNVVFCP